MILLSANGCTDVPRGRTRQRRNRSSETDPPTSAFGCEAAPQPTRSVAPGRATPHTTYRWTRALRAGADLRSVLPRVGWGGGGWVLRAWQGGDPDPSRPLSRRCAVGCAEP